jgi:predicted  nucleic acid-binding Zn-ribbon protein
MIVNECSECGEMFETASVSNTICPNCLRPKKIFKYKKNKENNDYDRKKHEEQ